MELIPSIDLLGGKVVRLRQGRYDDVTVYDDDAARLAGSWSGQVPRLHVVDLDGARDGRDAQRDLVRELVDAFGSGVQVGGGIRSLDAVRRYCDLGVSRVVMGTAAIRDPELVREATEAYPDQIVIAVDARSGWVATDGWNNVSDQRAVEVVKALASLPIAAVLYTDIERDGMEVGPNVVETARLADEGGLPVIASGGVGTLEHLQTLARTRSQIVGAIVGRALHERRFSLEQAVAAARAPEAG
ncbi:MAG TPA: 1-(5-phosphoribosyl)-5-[(5-phosphoribosylamino)methylideneamino]imidazole-4-carboxamide isomerase [Polyangiaceae bacterium]|nr:1-(5-phosphoribosyl)-5-[(5-phosphoribosylamino)methylideneamino]imidazole-4-carboxamide isomerase [Polyangiaceae bacterium]